jgi:MFS family permease
MGKYSFLQRFVLPCAVQMLQVMLLWVTLAYLTIYWTNLGFSHLQVGILIAVYPVTALALMVPSGIIADRISPKKMVLASIVISAINIYGLMNTTDFWLTFVFLAVGGISNAIFNNALPALYYKILGTRYRGAKLGIFTATAIFGYGVGPLIGGQLVAWSGMQSAFLFTLIALVPLFLLCLFLPDIPGTRISLSMYKADLANHTVFIFLIMIFLVAMHVGVEQTSFSLYLNKDLHIVQQDVGLLYFIQAMAMTILAVINGFIVDRITATGRGLSTLFYIGTAILGLTNMALFFATGFATALEVRLAHAVGEGIMLVTRSIIIAHLFVASRIGGNLGATTTTVNLAQLAGALLGGFIPGYSMALLVAGLLSLLVIPLGLATRPRF